MGGRPDVGLALESRWSVRAKLIYLCSVMVEGLANGGPQGLICSFIFAWLGVTAQTLVMADMGSMYGSLSRALLLVTNFVLTNS